MAGRRRRAAKLAAARTGRPATELLKPTQAASRAGRLRAAARARLAAETQPSRRVGVACDYLRVALHDTDLATAAATAEDVVALLMARADALLTHHQSHQP